MRIRPIGTRRLAAAAAACGLVTAAAVSFTLQAATNPNHTVIMICDTSLTDPFEQQVPIQLSGPDSARQGPGSFTMDQFQFVLPAQAGNGTNVNEYSNIRTKVASYGANVTGATIVDPGQAPGGAPTVAVSGNDVTLTIPGPIPSGTQITTPLVRIDVAVNASVGGTTGLRPSSPAYSLTADVGIAVDATCDPRDAEQAANGTLTIPVAAADTEGPKIEFIDPNEQAVYGFEEVVAASYVCSDPSGVATCAGPVANGAPLDTSSAGVKDFTVTATDTDGNQTVENVQYLVLPEGAPPPSRARYTPLNPGRLLDTRSGAGADTIDDEFVGAGKQGGGSTLELQVGGRHGIPANATAVVLNVTADATEGAGHVTVYPCDEERPTASNLNYAVANDIRPNAVVSKLDADGNVCLHAFGAKTHLIADAAGYFPAGARFVPLNPGRLFDTRAGKPTVDTQGAGGGATTAGSEVAVQIGGRHGVPDNAAAAVLNVTAALPAGAGHLTVYPCGEQPPTASNLNYAPADMAIPNLVVAKLGTDGKVCFMSGVSGSDLIVDVAGYYPAGADYTALVPGRLLDTRPNRPTVDGAAAGDGKPTVGVPIELQVGGRHDVPADALGVVLNVTAADTDAAGYLKVWPCAETEPLASNVNFTAPGQTRANAVFAQLDDDGRVCIVAKPASAHVVVDVAGYTPAPTGPVTPPPPPPPPTTIPGETTTTTTTTTLPPVPPGDCPEQAVYDATLALYNSLPELLRPPVAVTLSLLDPNGDGNACND